MDIRKLQRAIVDGLEDVKAQNIVVFNTEHLSPLFERVIIASGTSNRQTKALAASVRDTVKARGLPVLRIEGEDNGEWIIVDCGAAVAHIMQPAIREYYHLEEIWGGKPVKMKLDGEARARAGRSRCRRSRRCRRGRRAARYAGAGAQHEEAGAAQEARCQRSDRQPATQARQPAQDGRRKPASRKSRRARRADAGTR